MAGYTRQSTFADGDTITAALFNNEYNQLLNAFSNTGGHKHDGTANEGPVIGLIGDAGVVTPLNKVLIDSTNDHIEFWIEVSSSSVQQLYIADGAIVPVTDSDIDLGTTSLRFKDTYTDTITTTGNVAVGGNLTVTGTTTFNGGTITMGDAATDNVVFGADVDSNIIPDDDDSYDLGSSSQEWRNLYIDGTANIDSLVADTADINGGTIDGAVIGGSSAAAITGTAITGTSFVIGSATITEAELEILDGATVTTDELNILDGVTSTAAELNILDGVTSTAAELNLLDGVTSTTAELNILDGVTASAADINLIDGITNGTVIASKAIITDANKDITGGRNITISGELDAATLDISGNADIDGTLETDALSINGTAVTSTAAELNILDGKAFLDEDDMSSNSATGIASQQSIKAYVDTQITAEDLDITTDSGTIAIDLDSETLTVSGGTGLDSSATGNAVTLGIDSTVATLTGSQTLTNKTLTSPDVNTPDIDGGTIDGTVIGGATPAAGTFTTLTANTSITGTLATAAQPNITSVGNLTALTGGTGDLNWDSETLFVDSSANSVGIGTSSPSALLDISVARSSTRPTMSAGTLLVLESTANATAFTGMTILGGNSSGASLLNFGDVDNEDVGKIGYHHSDNSMRFTANASEKMRIDSSGNVGIGETSPLGKLHVKSADSGASADAGADELVVEGSGHSGLSILSGASNNGTILFSDSGDAAAGGLRYEQSNNALNFRTNGAWNRLYINSSGNVGIGTDSPTRPLTVNGNNGTGMIINDAANDKALRFRATGDAFYIEATNNAESAYSNLALEGNVGIGCTPTATSNVTTLEVSNATTARILVDSTGTGGRKYGWYSSTDGQFAVFDYDASAERMRIDSSGNLMVGTTDSFPGGGDTNTGVSLSSTGAVTASRDGDFAARFNRKTSDGEIIGLNKNGSAVGSIGADNGYLGIGKGDTGLLFQDDNDAIQPRSTTSLVNRDAAIDLGVSGGRFKDLHLSGVAYASTYRKDGDSDTYLNFPAANQLSLVGGGSTLFKAYQIAGAYGVLEAHGSGSATYPNYTFNGDSNTGMYRATTDTLAFTTGGSERLRVDSSGNVGIGTASPSAKLELFENVENVVSQITNNDGNFQLQKYQDDIYLNLNDNGNYIFRNYGSSGSSITERLRIDSSGNVGIGETTVNSKLEIKQGSANWYEGIRINKSDLTTQFGTFSNNSGATFIGAVDTTGGDNNVIVLGNSTNGTTFAEKMRIDSSGNVGIGTSSPEKALHIKSTSNQLRLQDSTNDKKYDLNVDGSNFSIDDMSAGSSRFTIKDGGNVGIGTSSPQSKLHITGTGSYNHSPGQNTTSDLIITSSEMTDNNYHSIMQLVSVRQSLGTGSGANGYLGFSTMDDSNAQGIRDAGRIAIVNENGASRNSATALSFWTNAGGADTTAATEKMRIDSSGSVGIKNSSPSYLLDVGNASSTTSNIFRGSVNGDFIFNLARASSSLFSIRNNNTGIVHVNTQNSATLALGVSTGTDAGTLVNQLSINSGGTVTIPGALSKGSGSFKIDHPLESKKDTHNLVHSFVEAPQADLIYRGKVDLVDGSATVNIDTVAGMTEGTFIALNTDVQCFTTNESDWDAVKGSVSGNTLTISCQNSSSTATVSWLVIGERHDQHMKDTDWTDSDGKVIVEPTK